LHRFVATTIGCKVNQYDTESVSALLGRLGLDRLSADGSDSVTPADLVVVNTCCVTAAAAAKSRRAVRRAVKRHPNAGVVILGCSVTRNAEALRRAALQAGATGPIYLAGHDEDVAACVRDCVARLAGDAEEQRTEQPSGLLERHRSGASGRGETPSPAGPVVDDRWMRAGSSPLRHDQVPSAAGVSTSMTPSERARVKGNIASALPSIRSFAGHQRAFVKVQDGCDALCSYCIVPYVRRRLWWRPIAEVVREVETLVGHGHREVVLCGVFLGAYGRETTAAQGRPPSPTLPELLANVAAVDGLWRVRLSSLHPGDVTDELLAVLADRPTVAPHLHLPLQSGSARILRRMNRRYGPDDFLSAVDMLRRAVDRPAITTDVLVGFPGETDSDFDRTLQVAREVGFARTHIFRFSPRPGTAAWAWRSDAPTGEVVNGRCGQLADLQRRWARNFRARFLGDTVEVLVEQGNAATPPGCHRGLTDRYLEVTFPRTEPGEGLIGQVVPVRVTEVSDAGLRGDCQFLQ